MEKTGEVITYISQARLKTWQVLTEPDQIQDTMFEIKQPKMLRRLSQDK